MDFTKYSPFLKQNAVPLTLGFLGLIFLGYGLIMLNKPKDDKPDILYEAASDRSAPVKNNISQAQKQITVDVEGAVLKPGVYKLDGEARVQDALIAAGGLSKEADRSKISQGLNLAARLTDGGKIYIPVQGEELPAGNSWATQVNSTVFGVQSSGAVNINAASESELDSLPGIGKVTAEKVIAGRPFSSIEELVEKKIVTRKVFEEIKEKIVAN